MAGKTQEVPPVMDKLVNVHTEKIDVAPVLSPQNKGQEGKASWRIVPTAKFPLPG
jgi:hypothetical protein